MVGVTILTGQLGSGKSTILKYILQNKPRTAVIMNEFAQTAAIEGKALTVARDGVEVTEWLELDNGCLCCSAQDNGVRAIESLAEKSGSFDYVILETSGVADPSTIAPLLWLDEGLQSVLHLDGVVTVIDALNIEKQLDEDVDGACEVAKQIACADALVLSKTDLLATTSAGSASSVNPATMASIRALNPHAPLYTSSNGVVDLTSLLHLDAYSSSPFRAPSLPAVNHDHDHSSRAHHGLSTLTIPLPTLPSIVGGRFDESLRTLLWEGALDLSVADADDDEEEAGGGGPERIQVLRCKGLLFSSPSSSNTPPDAWLVQGVREIYDITPLGPASSDDVAAGPRLVLIGRAFPADLTARFLASLEA